MNKLSHQYIMLSYRNIANVHSHELRGSFQSFDRHVSLNLPSSRLLEDFMNDWLQQWNLYFSTPACKTLCFLSFSVCFFFCVCISWYYWWVSMDKIWELNHLWPIALLGIGEIIRATLTVCCLCLYLMQCARPLFWSNDWEGSWVVWTISIFQQHFWH